MLVEHSFVTTLDEEHVLDRATSYLHRVGLRSAANEPAKKQAKNRVYAGLPTELIPRNVQLSFDRGRVSAAISIEPKRKPKPVHSDILMALVTGLERVIAEGANDDVATEAWRDVMARARRRVRRDRIVSTCVVLGVIAFIGGLLTWAAMA